MFERDKKNRREENKGEKRECGYTAELRR